MVLRDCRLGRGHVRLAGAGLDEGSDPIPGVSLGDLGQFDPEAKGRRMMEKRNLIIAACVGIPYVASLLADCSWLTLVTTLIGLALFVR